MKFYRYLFYWFFRSFLKKKYDSDIAHFKAILMITFFTSLNIASIICIVRAELFESRYLKIYALITFFFLLIIHFFLLVYKKKYLNIYEEFKDESESSRNNGTFKIAVYMVLSVLILIISAIFAQNSVKLCL
jgi:hypothetical protein